MNVTLRLDGLRALRAGAARAAAAAVKREMEGVVRPDALKRVPVDQGTLWASVLVEPPQVSGTSASAVLGAGGAGVPYALRQHEDLTYNHPSLERQRKGETYGQGEAKYLSNALAAAEPGQAARVGRTFALELGL